MVISVIIPSLNPRFNVDRLVASIVHADYLSKKIDLIIVGNLKSSLPYLKELEDKWKDFFYDLRVLCTGVKSANIARNCGIRLARGELYFFIDDDCYVSNTDYFTSIVDYMVSHKNVDAIGGCYILDEDYSQRKIDKTYALLAKYWLDQAVFNKQGQTQELIGGNCCYRAELFKKGFNFDPMMHFGGTETSLNAQLHSDEKILIYRPTFELKHRFRVSLYEFMKKAYRQGKGKAHNLKYNQLIDQVPKDDLSLSNFYTSCYNYFFRLGLNTDLKAEKGRLIRWWQYFELIFCLPRVLNVIRHYSLLVYYGLIHKVYCKIYYKIYYMSEYHWRVYIKPLGLWVKGILFGKKG